VHCGSQYWLQIFIDMKLLWHNQYSCQATGRDDPRVRVILTAWLGITASPLEFKTVFDPTQSATQGVSWTVALGTKLKIDATNRWRCTLKRFFRADWGFSVLTAFSMPTEVFRDDWGFSVMTEVFPCQLRFFRADSFFHADWGFPWWLRFSMLSEVFPCQLRFFRADSFSHGDWGFSVPTEVFPCWQFFPCWLRFSVMTEVFPWWLRFFLTNWGFSVLTVFPMLTEVFPCQLRFFHADSFFPCWLRFSVMTEGFPWWLRFFLANWGFSVLTVFPMLTEVSPCRLRFFRTDWAFLYWQVFSYWLRFIRSDRFSRTSWDFSMVTEVFPCRLRFFPCRLTFFRFNGGFPFWLKFFRAFSSVVRQMPRYNSQRQGTARSLPY